jgi:hypothetical protein
VPWPDEVKIEGLNELLAPEGAQCAARAQTSSIESTMYGIPGVAIF